MAAYASLADLSIFCRMFSTMLGAGVPPARCLGVLSQQQRNRKFKWVIADIQREVAAGNMLSKSLAKYPGTFSNLFIGLVRAGEIGGVLGETLGRLSTFLEKAVEMKRRTKLAMTFPMLIGIALVLIAVGLGAFISQPFWN
jgi:type IV pilus assembly protein PilC